MIQRQIKKFNLHSLLENPTTSFAFFIHSVIVLLLYYPILLGQIIHASEDNHHHHIPNLFFSFRAFEKGDWGLWNPYVLSGIPFSGSTHNYIYSPLSLLSFLFGESYLLNAYSCFLILELVLLGVVSFLFFKEELSHRRVALLCSVIYQLGSYTYFSITTYPTIFQFLIFTAAAYWIKRIRTVIKSQETSSAQNRRLMVYFVILSLLLSLIWIVGNIVYGIGIFTVIIVFGFYEFFKINEVKKKGFLFQGLILTATFSFALSAIRIFPFFTEFQTASRSIKTTLTGHPFFGMLFFNPISLGPTIESTSLLFNSFVNTVARNTQNLGFPYFGIFPFVLILIGIFSGVIKKTPFWFWTALLGAVLYLNPFHICENIPYYHWAIFKSILPLSITVLIGQSLMLIDSMRANSSRYFTRVLILLVLLHAATFYFWLRYSFDSLPLSETMISIVLLASTILLAIKSIHLPTLQFPTRFGILMIGFFFAVFLIFIELRIVASDLGRLTFWSSAIMVFLFTSFFGIRFSNPFNFFSFGQILFSIGSLGALLFVIYPFQCFTRSTELIETIPPSFCYMFLSFFALLWLYESRHFLLNSKGFYSLFALITLELLTFQKLNFFLVGDPFMDPNEFKPYSIPFDLKNYRVNRPQQILTGIERENSTNFPSIFGIRSYGGENSSLTARYYLLFRALAPSTAETDHLCANVFNERLLDLLGCRYDFDKNEIYREREGAIPRFSLFFMAHNMPLREQIQKINDYTFNLQTSILLIDKQSISLGHQSIPFKLLPYTERTLNHITLNVQADRNAYLLFNDSYHPEWKASVDGIETKVEEANFSFMAIPISKGTHYVEFKFLPRSWILGKSMTLTSFAFAFVLLLYCWARNFVGRSKQFIDLKSLKLCDFRKL